MNKIDITFTIPTSMELFKISFFFQELKGQIPMPSLVPWVELIGIKFNVHNSFRPKLLSDFNFFSEQLFGEQEMYAVE